MTTATKPWLDSNEYPFSPNYLKLPMGNMHYVDEGSGLPIVFVHGNPSWSYEFRNLIKAFSKTNRCIANDHIGFGLSDKPYDWDYLPEQHADNFSRFIRRLNIDEFILYVNDWGGAIGISHAINHPGQVRHLVITNTWMWAVSRDLYYRIFSGFVGGPMGRLLIKHFNFFGKVIARKCFIDQRHFHPAIYQHLETAKDRKGCWTFPKQIIASGDWLADLWEKREQLNTVPKTIIWGMGDIAFREKELNVWDEGLTGEKTIIRLDNVGHYPHEEAVDAVIDALRKIST